MTFRVTYREKSGAKAEVEIEAANRAACMAECRARGIVPVKVTEGRATGRTGGSPVQSTARGRSAQRAGRPLSRRLVAGVVLIAVLAGGGVLWWVLHKDTNPEPRITKQEKPKVTKPQTPPPKSAAKPVPATNAPPVATNAPMEAKPRPFNPNEPPPGLLPNEPWRSGRKKLHKVQYVARNTNTVHRNATEQALLDIFSCEVGDPPLPLTDLPREDLTNMWNILRSPNPITDKDAEDIKIGKETLELAKKELMKYIKDGGTPDEFLSYYHGVLEKAYQKRMIATEEIYKVLEEQNDPEIAREMLKRVNRELRNEGIRPLPIPLSVFQRKEQEQ